MAIRVLNSFAQNATSAAPAKLSIRKGEYGDGVACKAERFEVSVSMTNTAGVAGNFTQQDALDIVRQIFGSFSQECGKAGARDKFDAGLSFDELRLILWAATGFDFLVNGKSWQSFGSGTGTIVASVGPGASTEIVLEVMRPHWYAREPGSERMLALGKVQVESLNLTIVRGPVANTTNAFAQTGQASIVLMTDDVPADEDQISPIIRFQKNETPGLIQDGPDGALLLLVEMSTPGASTTLNEVAIERASDIPLQPMVEAARLVRDSDYLLPSGWVDPNLSYTVLFQADETVHPQQVPTGTGWKFHQGDANPMASPTTGWVYVPGNGSLADWAKDNVEGTFIAQNLRAVKTPGSTDPHVASWSAFRILRPDSPEYATSDGLLFQPGKAPLPHLSAASVQAAAAIVKAQPAGGVAMRQAQSHVARRVGLTIPGVNSLNRGRFTAGHGILSGLIGAFKPLF